MLDLLLAKNVKKRNKSDLERLNEFKKVGYRRKRGTNQL